MTTTLTTLQKHHMAQNAIHKMSAFRSEYKSIKEHLKMADDAMKIHDWASVEEIMLEVSAMANQLNEFAADNKNRFN